MAEGDTNFTNVDVSGSFKIGGTAIASSAAELNVLDGATAGTVVASKAVVVDSNKDISAFRNVTLTNLDAGASGTAGTVDIFPTTASKGKVALTAADSAGDTTTTIVNASQAGARTYTIPDAGASASFVMTEGAQTVNGVKTMASANIITHAPTGLKIQDSNASHLVTIAPGDESADRTLSIPVLGGADTIATLGTAQTFTGNKVFSGTLTQGSDATDRVAIKGFYMNPSAVAVAVPTIANDAAENVDEVAVDVSGSFSMQPAVGDAVIAIPQEALPTDCVLLGAWVSATDTVTVSFGSKEGGGGVTGANKNFKFLVIDLT